MEDPDSLSAPDLPDHVRANRAAWDGYAERYAEPGRRDWAEAEPRWGLWHRPESELHLLPDDLAGKDVIELGCGTAYVSAWLARLGARPVGIDNSPAQLATARALQQEFGLEFPLLLGNAETLPFPDASFDFAISEYGAALWADPYRWVPEAARVLRPGSRLVFMSGSPLLTLTVGDGDLDYRAGTQLLRPYFGLHRIDWPDDGSVEFHLPHGEWIRILRDAGFEIERLVEVQAAADAEVDPRWDFVTPEWAHRWPSEEAWIVRRDR
jgi:SAM-dependent methyltransferase